MAAVQRFGMGNRWVGGMAVGSLILRCMHGFGFMGLGLHLLFGPDLVSEALREAMAVQRWNDIISGCSSMPHH
jgi:hypothetical protein